MTLPTAKKESMQRKQLRRSTLNIKIITEQQNQAKHKLLEKLISLENI